MQNLTFQLARLGIHSTDLSPITIGQHTILHTHLDSALDQFMVWRTLRRGVAQSAYWPVLLPDPATLLQLHNTATYLAPTFLDTPRLLQQVETLNIPEWLTKRRTDYAVKDADFRAALAQSPQLESPTEVSYESSPLTYDFRRQDDQPWV